MGRKGLSTSDPNTLTQMRLNAEWDDVRRRYGATLAAYAFSLAKKSALRMHPEWWCEFVLRQRQGE